MEVIAKMADFLCEELQHERFGDVRPAIMVTAIEASSSPSNLVVQFC
jgi:senataxin